MNFRSARSALAVAAAALLLSACTSSGAKHASTPPAPSPSTAPSTASRPPSHPAAPAPKGNIYVSIGDSYAAGFQATGEGTGHPTHHGFADQTVQLARARGYHLRLVNFGCAGATTASVLHSPGCASHYPALGAPHYTGTQADAAIAYLKAHADKIALVTVSLGGNDIVPCSDTSNSVNCLSGVLTRAGHNLHVLLTRVHAAAPQATIVGTTYPDVFLGKAISSDSNEQQLARISVLGFRQFVNPTLKQAYTQVGGRFADVTAATGGYLPLSRTTDLAPYGTIPVAVAKVCRLTYYCQYGDIHPRTSGYTIIAKLVTADLPRR